MNESQPIFIIQARVGSTRLPNKVLMPLFKGFTILDIVIERLRRAFPSFKVVLATADTKENMALRDVSEKHKIDFYSGAEKDVLDRFVSYIDSIGFTGNIVRICADNPFLDMGLLRRQIQVSLEKPEADYISYQVNGTPSILTHYGIFAEVINASCLRRVHAATNDPYYSEHVSKYIYEHPESFDITWMDLTQELSDFSFVRLTIDTIQDFMNAQSMFSDKEAVLADFNYSYKEVFKMAISNERVETSMKALITQNAK